MFLDSVRSASADEWEDTDSSIPQPPKCFWVYLSSKVFKCQRLRVLNHCPKLPNLLRCHPLGVTGPKDLGCSAGIANQGDVVCRHLGESLWRQAGSGS